MANRSSQHGGYISEGAISSGTLRTQDLLRTFADEYERVLPFNGKRLANEARDMATLLETAYRNPHRVDEADEMLSDLIDALNDIAMREGLYFGAHEGDGACFGYWEPEEVWA
jgi:hypothetical protein